MNAKVSPIRFMAGVGANKESNPGRELPLDSIVRSETNRKIDTESESFKDLVASIERWGVYQPIVVRRNIDEEGDATSYKIIAGERRWLASKHAGKKTIIAIVKPEVDDVDALAMQISENIQREDYSPLILAEKLLMLKEVGGKTTKELAGLVGKSEKRISDILCQLNLISALRTVYEMGRISFGHVMYVARLAPGAQEAALRALFRIPDSDRASTADLIKRIKADDNNYMRAISEKDLRAWVNDNINLKMKAAQWSLEDADLVPEAGPCSSCQMRSINNPELYEPVAGTKDLCMDAACYKSKAQAFVRIQKAKAKEDEVEYLKLSDKESHSVLVDKNGTIKRNQWVPAKKGECKSAAQGIIVDGPSAGRKTWVCIDQDCKTHAHHGIWNHAVPAKAQTPRQRKAQDEREARARDEENAFRSGLIGGVLGAAVTPAVALRALVLDSQDWQVWTRIAELLEWQGFPASGINDEKMRYEYLRPKLDAMNDAELTRLLLLMHIVSLYDVETNYYNVRHQHEEVEMFCDYLAFTPQPKAAATATK